MTLAFNQNVAAGGTIKDAVTRGSGSEVVLVFGTTLRRFSLTTGLQVGSDVAVSGGGMTAVDAIGMVNTDKVCLMQNGGTVVKIVDLPTSGITAVGSLNGSLTSGASQTIAGDTATGVALGLTDTVDKLIRFTSAPAATQLTVRWTGNVNQTRALCITYKSTNRFIVGHYSGLITEITDQGVPVHAYSIPVNRQGYVQGDTGTFRRRITNLHFHQGWLLVSCADGMLYLMNHETGECLQRMQVQQTTSSLGALLSPEGGITAIVVPSVNAGSHQMALELDVFRTPMSQRSHLYTGNTDAQVACGIDGSKVWIAHGTTLSIHDLSGVRSTVNQTSQLNTGADQGKVMIFDDTGGVGSASLMFYTPIAAGGQSVPVTSGLSDILKVGSTGTGTDESFDLRRTTS